MSSCQFDLGLSFVRKPSELHFGSEVPKFKRVVSRHTSKRAEAGNLLANYARI